MVELEDKTVKSTKRRKEVLTTEKVLSVDEEVRQETLATEDVSVDQEAPTAVPLTSEVESSSTTSTLTSSTTSESKTEPIVATQEVSTSPPTTTTTIGKN